MQKIALMQKILWIDDEVDLLKPYFIFLNEKGYEVVPVSNAYDALNILEQQQNIDIIFLDQNMPGISGIELLPKIKKSFPNIPVIMITKHEEEELMDEAIAHNVDGFLIKPIKPNQILLILKQKLSSTKIIEEKLSQKFNQEYSRLMREIIYCQSIESFFQIYKDIIHWEMVFENIPNNIFLEFIEQLKDELNKGFCRYVEKNYLSWIKDENNRPLMIFEVLRKKILPLLDSKQKVFLIVIDNLRFDQWYEIKNYFLQYFNLIEETPVTSILPTTTHYARNSLFAGLLPVHISKRYPQYWSNETEEGNKNDYENELLNEFFTRNKRNFRVSFNKIFNDDFATSKLSNVKGFFNNDLTVFVFNFVDIVSHSKTQLQMIKDLAKDDVGYRSLVKVWFERSYLRYLIENAANLNVKIIITSDHGSVKVKKALKVIGDKQSSNNIRYKQGKNLNFNASEVFVIDNPEAAGLPLINISTRFIFARQNDFLLFPQGFHDLEHVFENSFQHGGISIEEMLVPFVLLAPKNL